MSARWSRFYSASRPLPVSGCGRYPRVEFVDIYVEKRPVAEAFILDDVLRPELKPRRPRGDAARAKTPCEHAHVIEAFAYRRSRDEHWPVSYCDDCLTIVEGRDPFSRLGKRPRWKYHEVNVRAARWAREWPKQGRPRRTAQPASISRPDAA